MFPFLRYKNPILNYHRVGSVEGDPSMTVSEQAFERQMRFLASTDQSIGLGELVELLRSGIRPLPRKIAVTFDDGYLDNSTKAFPLLKTHRIAATIFLVTEWIGKKKECLSWEAVREMSQEGVTFGSHTQSHPDLSKITSGALLEKEIRGSKEILEDRLGKPVTLFSYPFGAFNDGVKRMAEEAGYEAAVTSNRALDGRTDDLYALSRIKMTEASTSPFIFRVKTSGYYEQFKRKKRASSCRL